MSNDPMAVKGQPAPQSELGVVENVMRRQDMRKTTVEVKFVPIRKGAPRQPTRHYEFATAVMATDFIASVNPPPGLQLGSPKQLKAKRARKLNIQQHLIDLYDVQLSIVASGAAPAIGDNTGGVGLTEDDIVDEFTEVETTGEEDEAPAAPPTEDDPTADPLASVFDT